MAWTCRTALSGASAGPTHTDRAESRGRLHGSARPGDFRLSCGHQPPGHAAVRFQERAPALVVPSVNRPRSIRGAGRIGALGATRPQQVRDSCSGRPSA